MTGGTGFVGRNTVEFLLNNLPDLELTCLVRHPDKAAFMQDRVKQVHGDLLRPETYKSAVETADIILHMASLVSLKNGLEFYVQNTEATKALLRMAFFSKNLQRFVYTGSIAAIDRPPHLPVSGPLTESSLPHPNTDYGKSKLQAMDAVVHSGLPYTVLTPAYIYGPHPRVNSSMDRLIKDVAAGKPYTRIPFPGRASYIYVENLADLIWQAALNPAARNEVFFASEQEPIQVGEAFQQAAKALGVDYSPRTISDMGRFRSFLYHRDPNNPLLQILFEDYFYCSSEKVHQILNYRPRFGMMEGVEKTLQWYRKQGGLPLKC